MGVDESNNGSYPTIFVGVQTSDPTLLERHAVQKELDQINQGKTSLDFLKGHRLKKIRDIGEICEKMASTRFRYVSITRGQEALFGYQLMRAIAIHELASAFGGIDAVLIDGIPNPGIVELLGVIGNRPLCIDGIPLGDERYPVVNLADMIAYGIFMTFKRCKDYACPSRMIIPRMKKYSPYLNETA